MKFLLDTNVVSELMKSRADTSVLAWLDKQASSELFVSAITKSEVETGIAILADGKRKKILFAAARELFAAFEQRCLPFGCDASCGYGGIIAFSRCEGRSMSVEDAQIAAVAQHHGLIIATRNVSGCNFLALPGLVNPWGISN